MRVTLTLYSGLRDVSIRNWNSVWKRRLRFYDYPPVIPEALRKRGVEVVEMNQVKPDWPRWSPPVPDDPRFLEPIPLEQRPDWKTEPAYTYNTKMRLFEGVKQACILAKAQHFEGLPPAVDRLVGVVEVEDRDLLLQRYIMQAQRWNTSEDKLPKHFDPRKPRWKYKTQFGILPSHSSSILLRNLLRLSQSQVTRLDSLGSRRKITDTLLHSYVMYKGKPVVLEQTVPFMITSDSPLSPFGDESVIDASEGHTIPDMWPVYPTVDCIVSNNYQLKNSIGLSQDVKSLCPHTLLDISTQRHWDDTHVQGNQIMACLMMTAAMARRKFGEDVSVLPHPISIQHITLRETRLVFTYFQLNTLDLDSTSTGPKNLAWTHQGGDLCEKVLGQPWMTRVMRTDRLLSYDGSVFDPFLATYLNGVTEL